MNTDKFAWPELKQYEGANLAKVAMPIGGIGTGTVSIGGRGNFQDWEIMNRPAKGYTPIFSDAIPFLAIWTRDKSGAIETRMAEGPIDSTRYSGDDALPDPSPGLPRFAKASFSSAYPLAKVSLSDSAIKLRIKVEAFNPLVPGDTDASSWPVCALRVVIENPTDAPQDVAGCLTMPNFVGNDGTDITVSEWSNKPYRSEPQGNRNVFRETDRLKGVYCDSPTLDSLSESWGSIAIATTERNGVTHRTSWGNKQWNGRILDFWNDFSEDGRISDRESVTSGVPVSSLAIKKRVPAKGHVTIPFIIAWHFPNRRSWTPHPKRKDHKTYDRIGNHYAVRFKDAWDAAKRFAKNATKLERRTVEFVKAFTESDLPEVAKEAALFNLSTLRSQTCFRADDGYFYGWEGTFSNKGSCFGTCTHVWNFDQATAHVFPELARTMRRNEFVNSTDNKGKMGFRVALPLEKGKNQYTSLAADGQMGCLMKLYRDWQLSGDEDLLNEFWPHARRALEFAWLPGGWDADEDGVMEGVQHNTMDVEYFGPNPQCGVYYLGALLAGERMARHAGDVAFSEKCQRLFDSGSRWFVENLFNGDYFEQEIRPLSPGSHIEEGLAGAVGDRNQDPSNPIFQIGRGCTIDQLVGEWLAEVCDLGPIFEKRVSLASLKSVLENNSRKRLGQHFNHYRAFALGDESGVIMATWPRGGKPDQPTPYYTEVWTGLEYALASHLMIAGQRKAGLTVVKNTRSRFDGYKRNPFDETECGHHYARALSSWALVNSWTGFSYSAVQKALSLDARSGSWFWCSGGNWGTALLSKEEKQWKLSLEVLGGSLTLSSIAIGKKKLSINKTASIGEGKTRIFTL